MSRGVILVILVLTTLVGSGGAITHASGDTTLQQDGDKHLQLDSDSQRVPPRPGTESNGLSVDETATLWSRDADDFITNARYRELYGESRTAMQELANGTDITFKHPPKTAAVWSRNDFEDLEAGNSDTSIYPADADLEDGRFIQDAHATIFAIHPSTRTHLAPDETPLYIAPEGMLRGLVDYRVRVPDDTSYGNTTIAWRLLNHEIEEIRLKQDNDVLERTDGTQTPVFEYQTTTDWSATLRLEADIRVGLKRIERTEIRRCRTINNTTSCWTDVDIETTRPNETVTVSDSVDVEVYNLRTYPHYAEYPNGDVGVAIFQSRPWQGYTLGDEERDRVRGVWRFYTARDPDWDTLTKATATETTTSKSDALPVYVHAYPSEIGPRPELETGPEILEVWGLDNPSSERTIGPNVHVDVVNRQYTRSYGIAVRHDAVDRDALTVYGIVHGTTAQLVEPSDGSTRQLRESNLTVTVIEQSQSQATLRVELRDNETGAPIALELPERWRSITGESPRRGYIEIADQRVRTDLSGIAVVTVTDPGFYTARYHPESWLGNDPAYIEDSASTRWHPLTMLAGWWQLLVDFLWLLIPFGVMWYVSRRLMLMFWPDQYFER